METSELIDRAMIHGRYDGVWAIVGWAVRPQRLCNHVGSSGDSCCYGETAQPFDACGGAEGNTCAKPVGDGQFDGVMEEGLDMCQPDRHVDTCTGTTFVQQCADTEVALGSRWCGATARA